MALVWQYGEKSGNESWKGLSWGMVRNFCAVTPLLLLFISRFLKKNKKNQFLQFLHPCLLRILFSFAIHSPLSQSQPNTDMRPNIDGIRRLYTKYPPN